MGLSVELAPQSPDTAATAESSAVVAASGGSSAAAAACSPADNRTDVQTGATTKSSGSSSLAAKETSPGAPSSVCWASAVCQGVGTSSGKAVGGELGVTVGSGRTSVTGESSSRDCGTAGGSEASGDTHRAAGAASRAAVAGDSTTEDRSGSPAAAVGDLSDAATDTQAAGAGQTDGASDAVPVTQCPYDVITDELGRARELRLLCGSLCVGSSLTVGITSPLYASTLRRNYVNIWDGSRFCFRESESGKRAGGQRGGASSMSEDSSSIASRSGSEDIISSSDAAADDCKDNRPCGTGVDNTRATVGRSWSPDAGRPASSSINSNTSACSSPSAAARNTRRSAGTGDSKPAHCACPGSVVQAKEQSDMPAVEVRDLATATGEDRLHEDKNYGQRPEESKTTLRAALEEGPLGKLFQRFGAGTTSNHTGSTKSNATSNSVRESRSAHARRNPEHDQTKRGGALAQQQQPCAQQRQQDGYAGPHGDCGLAPRGQSRHKGGEHAVEPGSLSETAHLHPLQQQQIQAQRAAWPRLREETRAQMLDSTAAGAALPPFMTPLSGVLDDAAWKTCMGSDALAGIALKHSSHHASFLVLTELQRLRGEMLQLQVAAAAAKPANIIIQNKTEVAASTETSLQQPKVCSEEPGVREKFAAWLTSFFSNRLNQVVVLCGLGLGCYMLLEHWKHTWRMAQLRRRLDSNIVLRGVQMLEETIGVRRPQGSLYY